ncbi:Jerky [Araneus ventricosus]|uniref:Jerky n=1 Tax=Araneus ventricosus TaxID=182803 RepID=A0A4Y2GXI3_ARAVE|nr:Jerky [Araneus ventricosus]
MTIDLYLYPASGPCRAIIMAAQHLGIKLNQIKVDLLGGEQMKPEFVKMNPQHCVPTIDDNGFYLWESRAILTYLANKYAPDSPVYPKDPKERALVDRLLYFDIGTLYKAEGEYLYPQLFKGQPADPEKGEAFKKALDLLEGFLSKTAYVAGDQITLADFSIVASLSFAEPSSSKGEKRKHVTLTLNQKLEIIKRLEKGDNRNILMNEFNIGSSTIYDIKKQKDELMKFASQSVTTEKLASRQTLKKPKLEQLDSVLFKWFSAERSEGKPVTGPMIVEKAKKFGQDLGVAESECNYSDGWFRNFKFRHGIRRLDVTGETFSANQNSAEKYKDEFEKIVADNDLTPEQIYNADETGLLWRCLPTSTLAGGGEKAAKGFKKKQRQINRFAMC